MTITLVEIDSNVQGSSTTSLVIGTGLKSFTLAAEQPFIKGMGVTARYDDSNTMTGTITKVRGTLVEVNVASVTGSGTYAAWELNGERTLYLSTESYASPSNVEYIGDIIDAGTIEQYMYSAASTFGESKLTKGNIRVSNKATTWDFVRQLGFASGSIRIKQIENHRQAVPTESIFTGTVLYPEIGFDYFDIEISDRLADLAVPAQEVTFAGTNSGATGIEGNANGIKGQIKPFGLGGEIFNVSAKLVNETLLIYGLNFDYTGATDSISSITSVLDSGLALTLDTSVGTSGDVANLAALQAATITAGQYATCLAEGLFRLASSPDGVVTVNFTQDTLTGAGVVKALIERIGYTSSAYINSTFTAVDSDNSNNQELYDDSGRQVLDLSTEIMNGMGGYIIADTDNKFRVGLLKDPASGTSQKTFTEVINLQRIQSKDDGKGIPPKQIKLQYKKNYTPLEDGAFAGAVTDTQRLLLKNQYLETAGNTNQSIERKHPTAPIFNIFSHLVTEANAITERERQETLRQTERDFYSFTVSDLTPLNLGDVITLQIAGRFNLSSGKKAVIVGKEINLLNSTITYLVWC